MESCKFSRQWQKSRSEDVCFKVFQVATLRVDDESGKIAHVQSGQLSDNLYERMYLPRKSDNHHFDKRVVNFLDDGKQVDLQNW